MSNPYTYLLVPSLQHSLRWLPRSTLDKRWNKRQTWRCFNATEAFIRAGAGTISIHFRCLAKKMAQLTFKLSELSDQRVYRLNIAENALHTSNLQIFLGGCPHNPLAGWGLWPHINWWTATFLILAKSMLVTHYCRSLSQFL